MRRAAVLSLLAVLLASIVIKLKTSPDGDLRRMLAIARYLPAANDPGPMALAIKLLSVSHQALPSARPMMLSKALTQEVLRSLCNI